MKGQSYILDKTSLKCKGVFEYFFFKNNFLPQPFDRPSLTTLHPSLFPSIRPPKIHWFPTIPEFIFFLFFTLG